MRNRKKLKIFTTLQADKYSFLIQRNLSPCGSLISEALTHSVLTGQYGICNSTLCVSEKHLFKYRFGMSHFCISLFKKEKAWEPAVSQIGASKGGANPSEVGHHRCEDASSLKMVQALWKSPLEAVEMISKATAFGLAHNSHDQKIG